MRVSMLLLFVLTYYSCSSPSHTREASNLAKEPDLIDGNRRTLGQSDPTLKFVDYDLANSLGLIKGDDERLYNGETARIYNSDGTIWYEFNLQQNDLKEQIGFQPGFRPFRYDYDHANISMNIVGEDDRFYHVNANEENGTLKYIRKNDLVWVRKTWERYVLDCFAVEFDSSRNPIRNVPDGEPLTAAMNQDLTFHPIKITGDWLEVQWSENVGHSEIKKSGWVRWKFDQKLVLRLFEIA